MSTIKVSNLYPVDAPMNGYDLLSDSESYLEEMSDTELLNIKGGFVVSQVTVSAGYLGAPIKDNANNFDSANNQNYVAPGDYEYNSFFLTSYGIKTYAVNDFR